MDYAITVGVESYQAKSIATVDFADADATDVAQALRDLGFTTEVLTSQNATKTTIESRVNLVSKRLTADDTLYFFYAGHGFSSSGKNYITCHDTQPGDLERTSIQLQAVLEVFRRSKGKRIALFLDACESGMLADLSQRGIFSVMNDQELTDFFADSEFYACFSACKSDESSYPYGAKKHGIWTFHLLQALRGNAKLAMEGGLVTSTSLQNYLAREIPKTIRTVRTDLAAQTPWACGSMSKEFVVADLRPILAARQAARLGSAKKMTQATLKGQSTQDIRRLSGFNKRYHHVPTAATSATDSFVANIAKDDLKEHLDRTYEALKAALGYKRSELQPGGPDEGSATIQTPHFRYEVRVCVDPDDPSCALWRHEISQISDQNVVLSDEFERALGKHVDTVEYELATAFDVEEFIDHVEEAQPDGVTIRYPPDASECSVTIDGFDGTLVLTAGSIILTGLRKPTPRALVKGLHSGTGLLVQRKALMLPPV